MHREAKRFENEIANDLRGRRVFLSGAGPEKADVRRKATFRQLHGRAVQEDRFSFRVEAKTTQAASFTLRMSDWADLVRVADPQGEIPIFAVKFLSRHGLPAPSIAVVRHALAVDLSLLPAITSSLPNNLVKKTRRLHPYAVYTKLVVPGVDRRGLLTVVPYHDLVERLRQHAYFG